MSESRVVIREVSHTVRVEPNNDLVVVQQPAQVVVPGVVGIQGPPGPKGDTGASDARYIHTQSVPSAVWSITHNLGRKPSVVVVDSSGDEVEGDVHRPDDNTLTITFSGAFSGTATLGG